MIRSTMLSLIGVVLVLAAASPVAFGQRVAKYPTYQRSLQLEKTSETSANISFGDLDGDGHLDIVLAKGRHWPLVDRVLIGDGKGGIRDAHDLGTASDRSYSGRLVDMDGDGSLDVVISNDRPDPGLVYLNDGTGHFRVGSSYGKGEWSTRNASVADLNNDGRPDIIVANRSNDATPNFICLNQGKGMFGADCLPVAPYPTTTITAADFNKDGLLDLVAPHRNGGQAYVYLAGPKATYSDARRIPFGPKRAATRIAESADFNHDGLMDIVAIDEDAGASIYFGQENGSFANGVSLGHSKIVPYALIVGDLDRDGTPDIVVGNIEAPSVIYFNDGSGRQWTPVKVGDGKGDVYGFAIGDLDEDGVLDLGVARSGAPNVVYFGKR
jgi:hypothetical protein